MFFVVTIKNDSQSINRHDTESGAKSAFHREMNYAYDAGIETCCFITDRHGKRLKLDENVIAAKPEP